ncbi:helix-turn-helix domain-containing protein [Bradyrhizobium pachyrhizi]|uniref:helix-turn-helix domain-containing protein n=1 Tax=Bradyrhizobium pachyrhizi TaxID=280333 RepID=UPI00067AF0D1|nr:helix-turn-helix transcriptional regulator [Bradyrhizobium pachyrhizi]
MTTPLGDKIRDLRKKNGFTLDKLAELAESSKSYIWELENKDPPRPSADKIAKIATALGVTPDYLITDSVQVEDAKDTAFYRKYRSMNEPTKEKIRKMLDLIGEPTPKDDE